MNVVKIGGSTLRSAADFEQLIEHLRCEHQPPTVVVLSALPLVTRRLEAAALAALEQDEERASNTLRTIIGEHHTMAHALITTPERRERLQQQFDELHTRTEQLLRGIALTRELTPRTLDRIVSTGERLALHLVACFLEERGLCCAALPATELVVTDGQHGNAQPIYELTAARATERLLPLLERCGYVLTEGFVGQSTEGHTVTMGKESSSLTAALLASIVGAERLVLYTPVAGIYTADPLVVPEARLIPQLSYAQAETLAHLGLKLLYPTMIALLQSRGIELHVTSLSDADMHTQITAAEPHKECFVVLADQLELVQLDHQHYWHAIAQSWHHRGAVIDAGDAVYVAAEPAQCALLVHRAVAQQRGPIWQLRVWVSTESSPKRAAVEQRMSALPQRIAASVARCQRGWSVTAFTASLEEQELRALHTQLAAILGQ